MGSARWLALLLLVAGLAGCIGSDDQASELASAAAEEGDRAPASLPPGLTMDVGEVVSYNDTTVVWARQATAGSQIYQAAPTRNPSITSFDVPAGIPFHVEVNVAWEDANAALWLILEDQAERTVCEQGHPMEEIGVDERPATLACQADATARDDRSSWHAVVDHSEAGLDTDYTLTVTLTARPAPVVTPAVPELLEGPPAWPPGDWWEVRLIDPLTRSTSVVTQVVADVEEGMALVGTSHRLHAEQMLLGVPALGQVGLEESVTWSMRGEAFTPVAFPLETGKTWETTYHGYNLTAEIRAITGDQVHLAYTGEADLTYGGPTSDVRQIDLRAVYDASEGMLVNLSKGPNMAFLPGQLDLPTFRVLDHGSNATGPVYVPTEQALVFDHGMRSSAVETVAMSDTVEGVSVDDRVEIHEPYTDLAFVQIVGRDLGHTAGDTLQQVGYYHEHAYWQDFNGNWVEDYEFVVGPAQVSGLHTAFHDLGHPQGVWALQRTSTEPGVSMTQGLAYTLLRYDAPGEGPEVLG